MGDAAVVRGFYGRRELVGGYRVPVRSPDGPQLAVVEAVRPRDAVEALGLLAESQDTLAAMPPEEVAGYLREAAEYLHYRSERLASLASRDSGMPRRLAVEEVSRAVEALEDPWRLLRGFHRLHAEPGVEAGLRRVPGVGLVVAPYTSPLAAPAAAAAFLLMSGVPVAFKPSMKAPLATAELARALAETGLERHVALLPGSSALGSLLASDRRVKAIVAYTSPATASTLWRLSWGKRAALNSLGRAAAAVLAGADAEEAGRAVAASRLAHSGQACGSTAWAVVDSSVYEPFIDAALSVLEKARPGPPDDPASDTGPLIARYAVEKAERIVRDAASRGALVHRHGSPHGLYYPPTLIEKTPKASEALDADIQAPILAVVKVEGAREAASVLNAIRRASIHEVYTYDSREADEATSRLEAPIALVNPHLDPEFKWTLCTAPATLPGDPMSLYTLPLVGVTIRFTGRTTPPEEPY